MYIRIIIYFNELYIENYFSLRMAGKWTLNRIGIKTYVVSMRVPSVGTRGMQIVWLHKASLDFVSMQWLHAFYDKYMKKY